MNDKQLIEFHFRGNDSPLAKGLQTLTDEKIVARIWEHDHTVWKPEPKEIANRLGWLNSIEKMHQESPRMNALSNELRAQGYTQALLLGMGGSSLAPQVFSETFDPPNGLELSVLDSTDPGAVIAHAERLDIEKTLFIVATKSGSTVETLSFFKYFFNQVADTLGKEKAGEHFVAITDPGSNLVNIAKKHDFREVFLNDPNIGGRYSALSFFGLVPAALVGVDISKLLRRAQTMATQCSPETTTEDNPAAKAGAIMGQLAKGGQDKITFVASPAISDFPNWVEQLIAESTGKEGIGILPVVGEPVGDPTVYQDDRLFVHLKVEADDTHQADLHALSAAGHAVMRLQLEDIYDLGGQFFLWEFATALAGYFLGINPFDQPNVESAKIRAREMVAAFKEKGALPPVNYADPTAEVLDSFIADSLSPGGTSPCRHTCIPPQKWSGLFSPCEWGYAIVSKWQPPSGTARDSFIQPGSFTKEMPARGVSSNSSRRHPATQTSPLKPETLNLRSRSTLSKKRKHWVTQ